MRSLSKRREPCPMCSTPTSKHHCKSPYCSWFLCTSHSENAYTAIVFDSNKRFFVQRTTP